MTGASIRFPHLGIVIEHLGKSISIFGFDIAYYGIIIGVGMLCGIAMAVHEAKRTGQNPEMYYDFALCAIISAIVGCRIYYVAFEWSYYSQHPLEIFNLRQGGLATFSFSESIIVFTKDKTKWSNSSCPSVIGRCKVLKLYSSF